MTTALINTTPAPTPAPPDAKTLANLLAVDVAQLKASPQRIFSAIVPQLQDAFTRIWANRNGFTPQQVLTALGTSAGPLLQGSALLVALLENPAIAPGSTATFTALVKPTTTDAEGNVTVNS